MARANWAANRKNQEDMLKASLDDAGIAYEWTHIDGGPCALVDLGDGLDVELWAPNATLPSRPQYLRAELWRRGPRCRHGFCYVHERGYKSDSVEDAARLVEGIRADLREQRGNTDA